MKKTREGFSLSAKKAGFVLACMLIPFSMLNGAAQSSGASEGTEVKNVAVELQDSGTIVLPPQAAGTSEPVEFHAADKEPAEKKNVYENSGKAAANFEEDAPASPAQTKAPAEGSQTQTAPAASSGQTTTIVEPPYTTTKVTTETVTTKTVTTETRTTESSITSGPGLPAEERVDGPLAPIQEKHSWDTPSTQTAPAAPKANAQEAKPAPKKTEAEKKQEPEANLKIKETEPKKKPQVKQPAKTEAKPAAPKAQTSKPAAKGPEKKTEAKPVQKPAQNKSEASPAKANQPKKESTPSSNAPVAKPAPVTTEKEASPAPKASQTEQKSKPLVPAESETPSRSVTLKNSQYLDVIYPGSGWIYLGEKDANDLMRYYGRKVSPDGEETAFTLKATKSGSTVLHFYKNDALAGKFIEDYLAVTVSTETERDTHVKAPNYANYVPKGQRGRTAEQASPEKKAQATSPSQAASQRPALEESPAKAKIAASSSTGTAIERASTANAQPQEERTNTRPASNAAAGDLLKKAQQEYDAKQYAECLETIQEFYRNADESKMDQALYLEARALEAPSPSRNIKSALHTYQTLVNRYPQSSLWEAANNRITYIQRMYIDIR
ncbi:MAG: hypothetical protein K6E22_09795 [Treponema sp.]|nr:hypothetical protein [Treponema sp.]